MKQPASSNEESFVKPASSTEIMQALQPYLSTGPSGLAVSIGRSEITLRREQRKAQMPRGASLDHLIEAAVDLTGPLTQDEAESIFQPYADRTKGAIAMEIKGDIAYLTRKAHTAKFMTTDKQVKVVHMKERVVSTSLDVPMQHLKNVLDELTGGGEMFE